MAPAFTTLLVDDNPADVEAIRRAWRKGGLDDPLYIVESGEECLDYLQHKEPYGTIISAPPPSLLVLDIHLPGLDGFEVLQAIRHDLRLNDLPVVMMSGVIDEEAYTRGDPFQVNAYIEKSHHMETFMEQLQVTLNFWKHNTGGS